MASPEAPRDVRDALLRRGRPGLPLRAVLWRLEPTDLRGRLLDDDDHGVPVDRLDVLVDRSWSAVRPHVARQWSGQAIDIGVEGVGRAVDVLAHVHPTRL